MLLVLGLAPCQLLSFNVILTLVVHARYGVPLGTPSAWGNLLRSRAHTARRVVPNAGRFRKPSGEKEDHLSGYQ